MKFISALAVLFAISSALANPPSTVESYQVLYLGDSGVVVLQMQIQIEGRGVGERFDSFVDSLMKALDKNGDGVVTVEEARGKILTRREATQMQLIAPESTPFDATPDMNPKDGKISRAELLAYFKRIGISPFTVKLRSRVAQADPNDGMAATTGDVPLFATLDVDGDKKLSVEELQNALEVLRKLDRDDDETISVAELQPLASQPRQANRRAANNPPPPTIPFLSLASGDSVQKLIRRLVDKYDSSDSAKSGVPSLSTKNQKLSRAELGLPEAKFNGYDEDGDGQLDFAELRRFVSTPESDLELVLDITAGQVEVKGSPGPEVRVAADGTVSLSYGTSQINISTSPVTESMETELMVKPFFMALDSDANGYLEKSEAPENALMGTSFADLDEDNNGKLYLEEIVGYLNPRIKLARSRVELVIIEQGRTLFEILDSDRDGRLAHREVRGIASKLASWDTNGDGFLSESEIPLQFQIIATQGDIPLFGLGQPAIPAGRNGTTATRTSGPTWFNKMDRNRDGEVSRREFLGEPDLFEKLDLNHNGAIELNEAIQAKG